MAAAEDPVNWSSSMLKQDNVCLDDELSRIPVVIPQLGEFCDSHEVEMDSVLRLTWSLVLGIYTGASDICFHYIRHGTASNESPLEEWVHRVDIDRSTPIIDLLKRSPSNKLYHNGGLLEETFQDLAPEECDSVLMLNVGPGRVSHVLGKHDPANVGIAECSVAAADSESCDRI